MIIEIYQNCKNNMSNVVIVFSQSLDSFFKLTRYINMYVTYNAYYTFLTVSSTYIATQYLHRTTTYYRNSINKYCKNTPKNFLIFPNRLIPFPHSFNKREAFSTVDISFSFTKPTFNPSNMFFIFLKTT